MPMARMWSGRGLREREPRGRLVAQRLAGFDVRLLAYDPFVSADSARTINVEMTELDDLLSRSDFVTIHLPKNAETVGLFNAERFTKFKPGARLVNAARGGVVVEADLAAALDNHQIAGAALDVFDIEPLPEKHTLKNLPNTVLTPHLGYVTLETYQIFYEESVENISAFLNGVPMRSLNIPTNPR